MSPVTNSGLPIATMRMSADRVTLLMSRVREWQTVTVALPPGPSGSSKAAIGRPTMLERPTPTACAPLGSTPLLIGRCWTPSGAPGRVPSISLGGIAHRARLADHDDPDVPRILQLGLDFLSDLLGQLRRLGVVHRGGRHHHTHLPARLNGEDFLDTRKLPGQLLELGQPFDVGLEGFAPRARA